jgi:F-type H+-transporting ATPase subunit a
MNMKINIFTEIPSPLDQFEIRDLLSLDIAILNGWHLSITNTGLYLTVGVLFILGLYINNTPTVK